MLPSTITLAVDRLNNGTTTPETWTRYDADSSQGKAVYHGPTHSFAERQELAFLRKLPVKNGDFLGTARPAQKFTSTVSVVNAKGETVKALYVREITESIPVGMTAAQLLVERQRAIALMDQDSIMTPHEFQLEI